MPWQRQVADVALEVDPDTGRLVYREVALTVPRQSGKTTLLLALMTHRALGFKVRQNIAYTAQTRNDARKKWEDDHLPILEASPFGPMFTVRKTNGNEGVLWRNGSRQTLTATTEKSGHGPTLDLGMIDEAFAQVDGRLEQAYKPSMITRPEPQLWVVSTAGTPESVYLWSKVEKGRERCERNLAESVCYFEWSAADGLDAGSPDTWASCMPALGHTITVEAIAADYASMETPEFERAYLNRWNTRRSEPVISAHDWERTTDVRSAPLDPVTFAVEVAPDRASSTIAVAGVRRDTRVHCEVVDNRPGTGWIVDRLLILRRKWSSGPVVVDGAGPAGALLNDLVAAGIEVKVASTREHQQACGAFYDGILECRYMHRGQPVLTAAVDGAERRYIGDSWLWSRKTSSVDITPLVAVTLAAWGHQQTVLMTDVTDSIW